MSDISTRRLLVGALLMPVIYFGMQLVLAPFFPGYSFLQDATSVLGSDRSPVASWFNAIAICAGILGSVGAYGVYLALRAEDGGMARSVILPLFIAVIALGCIWAGVFPMPHPWHARNPSAPAMILMPAVALAYTWWSTGLRNLRPFLIGNLMIFLLLVSFMAGLVPVDRGAFGGLLQRLLALPVFVPIAVIGAFLLSRAGHPGARTGR